MANSFWLFLGLFALITVMVNPKKLITSCHRNRYDDDSFLPKIYITGGIGYKGMKISTMRNKILFSVILMTKNNRRGS